jgi:site-specific recombinase XerD
VSELPYWIEQWLLEGECRLQSPRTHETRRIFLKNLRWFLEQRDMAMCGPSELRQFFAYLAHGHKEPGGRWGQGRHNKPLRPVSIKDYHWCLRAFFGWLHENDVIETHPMASIPQPIVRTDQKPPLSPEQVQALLLAARKGAHARRDEAIVLFLLDTGVRASELVSIQMQDLDISGRRCRVLGKGNKYRTVFLGRETTRVLLHYLRGDKRKPQDPVFVAERSRNVREPLTRSGLQQIIRKHARAAGIGQPVSPHGLRRTFAVEILKNGANVFSLREMLGHTNLQMTQKYLLLAQADVEDQHRLYSPADSFERKLSKQRR